MKKNSVPKTAITENQLKKLIKKAAKKHSSQAEWAQSNDITPAQVSAFLRKTQSAGLKIPQVLGYRPQTIYLPMDEPLITTPNPPRRVAQRPSSKVDHSKPPIEKGNMVVDDRKETKKRLKKRNKK